jgi:Zn finger protein HypA/HybF involved in hydrogenase expression
MTDKPVVNGRAVCEHCRTNRPVDELDRNYVCPDCQGVFYG